MSEPVPSSGEREARAITLPPVPLAPGDRVPNFMAADQHGAMRPFYERTLGRPLALLLAPQPETLADFAASYADFVAAELDILALVPGESGQFAGAADLPFLILGDAQGRILGGLCRAAGLTPGAGFLLLDPNQRLIVAGSGAMKPNATKPRLVASIPVTSRETAGSIAPILIVPEVLDRPTRLALIRRWHEQGHDEGRVAGMVKGQQTHEVYESLKKRQDHIIRDEGLTQILAATIGRRVAPEMAKAFHFTVGFRFENFKIVCYDAARGDYFRRHRDSQGPGTGNRMFAMTLNLNSEEYEGGELIFPEYGQQRYKPPSGGAVVFSCALVHEAMPVLSGRRFALLTFFLTLDSKPSGPAR
jgi:predicted 2-oxoglutarate/Fe(II)-dependent dioxygenase YbiX